VSLFIEKGENKNATNSRGLRRQGGVREWKEAHAFPFEGFAGVGAWWRRPLPWSSVERQWHGRAAHLYPAKRGG
jgi:hypothetical protein